MHSYVEFMNQSSQHWTYICMQMPASVEVEKDAWIPVVEMADRGPETKPAATQTDGIFYPSAQTLSKKKGTEFIKKMIHISARDRLPKLHSFSPGKGKVSNSAYTKSQLY